MRILIATVTAGAGHLQAAAAVEEAWRRLCPHDLVRRVDLLDFVPKLQRHLYARGYVKVVEHAPEVWGLVFRQTDDLTLVRRLTRFRRAFAPSDYGSAHETRVHTPSSESRKVRGAIEPPPMR